jgi:NADH dehydrogenase [ubiquinone] 1 alpha subcomplex assembly factor 7
LIELGPGRGTMMADVLNAGRGTEGFVEALNISLVEISPALKAAQEDTLVKTPVIHAARSLNWLSDFCEIPDSPDAPLLVIANEFIDAIPVQQFQMTVDGWRERLIGPGDGDDGDRGFRFVLADGPPPDGVIPPAFENGVEDAGEGAPKGTIVEARPAADQLVRAIAERLSRRPGAALIIDYGHEQSAAGDTLQAVKAHEFHAPLEDPGDADLTAHVDFAELCRVATEAGAQIHGPVSQGAFLQALGIGVRADALIKASPSHRQDIGQALSRLTSDDGMGRLFKVLALVSPGMPPPPGFD